MEGNLSLGCPDVRYVSGKENCIDLVDVDEFSICALGQMFKTLDYSDDELVEYWCDPGLNLEEEEVESEDFDGFEVDLDGFGSLSDDENDPPLKSTLKKLRKKNAKAIQESGCPFYLGQSILEKKKIKRLVTAYAVKTRRQLYVVKNDRFRFRVICMGKHPHSCVIGPDETKNSSEAEK
ncbi:hypothetical protein QVD17_39372 [Tagetes erecta]|uniref:Transposase MuDR plant domain-containing protein n=1 Tax=Tagetes erecta TaxID=13708 RepID=A0AAD8NH28_TARER|nr:hypothetical protein QVD17_39372 [Tagetes erecta]